MTGKKRGGPSPVSPELGCAGLAIAAARQEGRYTEIEADLANAALMKLLMVTRPQATALRKDAEDLQRAGTALSVFASAAADLPPDRAERLVTQLWCLLGEEGDADSDVMKSVMFAFGMDKSRVLSLRPVA